MSKICLALINFYQVFLSFDGGVLSFVSPGGACKFEERCSQYTKRMIIENGAFKGLILGAKRIWSCR